MRSSSGHSSNSINSNSYIFCISSSNNNNNNNNNNRHNGNHDYSNNYNYHHGRQDGRRSQHVALAVHVVQVQRIQRRHPVGAEHGLDGRHVPGRVLDGRRRRRR